jgi:hypothetical protein
MDKQRSFVAQLVAANFPGERITRTDADFDLLQKIVDAKLIPPSETWQLQSLGIVLGDALASTIDGLSSWEVTDEYGTDPTLRYRQTSLHLNALTMLSKQIEDGKPVDVRAIARWLESCVAEKGRDRQLIDSAGRANTNK